MEIFDSLNDFMENSYPVVHVDDRDRAIWFSPVPTGYALKKLVIVKG